MSHWNRQEIAELVLAAGEIALRHYDAPHRQIKADGSIVTQADREVEAFLAERFDRPEAGTWLLGEESEQQKDAAYLRDALAGTMYVVDPIDGTAPYAYHIPIWGVSVGLAEAGVLAEGCVYLPVTRELFITEGDAVWFAELRNWRPGEAWPWRRLRAEDLPAYQPCSLIAITQSMAKVHALTMPNPVHSLACAVVPLCYLLLGRYAAYFGTLKLWDLAGALPMLHKLGLEVHLMDGTRVGPRLDETWIRLAEGDPKRWKVQQPMAYAPPEVFAALRSQIEFR